MRKIFGVLIGLIVAYLLISSVWSLLNTQSCTSNLPKNATCEEIAENNANNCEYVILRWKKIDYDKELQQCREWEQNNN